MKQERIFEALNDIGDDLLEMARSRRFINHWRRWGRTAACLALVICLTALALPYFPIGCGATQKTAPAPEAAPEAAPAPERAPEAAPVPEAAPAPEAAPEAEENPLEDATEAITVWFNDTAYELLPGVTSVPEDLGEQLGEVTSSDGRDLTGCSVFAAVESEDIYVEVPEGYLRGMKTE